MIFLCIAKDVETRFDTSSYELDRQLPKAKNKKVIRLMKDDHKICCTNSKNKQFNLRKK